MLIPSPEVAQLPWEPELVPASLAQKQTRIHQSGCRQSLWSPVALLSCRFSLLYHNLWDGAPVSMRFPPGEMPPHRCELAPITHLSPSLWKLAWQCQCSSCFPCSWAVAAPQALARGTGLTPNHPKNPLTAPHIPNLPKKKKGKNPPPCELYPFRDRRWQTLSAWRTSCGITPKFKNIEFLGGCHPQVALTSTGAWPRLCCGTAGKAAPHPQLSWAGKQGWVC